MLSVALLCLAASRSGALPVTMAADAMRTGWYPDQPQLAPATVSGPSFGQLFSTAVTGSVYAQPLVWNGILLAVTEQNEAYGLDAETGAIKWTRSLGAPFDPSTLGCGDLLPRIGVTGTPAIDGDTGTAYLVAKVYASGTAGPALQQMHALDLTTGAERSGFPVTIQGHAANAPQVAFNGTYQLQRPGLLLLDGVVYAAFGGHCDVTPYQGWVASVSTSSALTSLWTSKGSGGSGGGIWQSGGALASDGPGSLFFITGNAFEGGTPSTPTPGSQPPADLGESVVRLRASADGTLAATDFFTPYDGPVLDQTDLDFGSGGPVLLPDSMGTAATPRLLLASGKEGYVYLLDRDALGGARMGPGGGDAVVGRFGPYAGTFSSAAVWPGAGLVYFTTTATLGAHLLQSTPALTLTPVGSAGDAFGLGSSSPVVTSDGLAAGTALVWVVWMAGGDGTNAQLRAYDAVPVGGHLALRYSAPIGGGAKFARPGVGSGRIYVGTRDGHVLGFGAPIEASLAGAPLSFPAAVVGSQETRPVTLTALQPVTVEALEVAGAAFALGAAVPPLPAQLATGDTLVAQIVFSPSAPGLTAGTLTAKSAGRPLELSLDGAGLADAPLLRAAPAALSFGGAAIGKSLSGSIELVNLGSRPLTFAGSDGPALPFAAVSLPQAGDTLAPLQKLVLQLSFSPGAAGSSASALAVRSDGGNLALPLTGSATPPGVLTVLPLALDFGVVEAGARRELSFTVANTGGSPLALTRSKPPARGAFLQGLELPEGTVLQPGSVLAVPVVFAPATGGPAGDAWQLNSDGPGGAVSVQLTGVAHNGGRAAIPSPPLGGWQLNGSAALLGAAAGSLLQLTDTGTFEAGSAFWPTPLPSEGLAVEFDAVIGGGSGADGMALVLADAAKSSPTALGPFGSALGFGGITGLGVALDTYLNEANPSDNFIGLTDGPLASGMLHWLATSTLASPLRPGPTHVKVTTGAGVLTVWADGVQVLASATALPALVLVGFSGGTGGLTDQHAAANVSVTTPVALTPPQVALLLPAAPANVSGAAPLSAAAVAAAGSTIASVSLLIDGTVLASGPGGSLAAPWDTTALDNGSVHLVTAAALGSDGAGAATVALAMTVSNPPAISLQASVPQGLAKGGVSLRALAAPPRGSALAVVTLEIDGQVLAASAGPSVEAIWDTTALPNGSTHLLSARAIADDGTSASAPAQAVTVENPPAVSLSLSLEPAEAAVLAGETRAFTVRLVAAASGQVRLSLGELPSGLVGSLAPAKLEGSGTAQLTLTADAALAGTRATFQVSAATDSLPQGAAATGALQILAPPQVTLEQAAPRAGAPAGSASLSASATADPSAGLSRLAILEGAAVVADGRASPLLFTTSRLTNGAHTYVALAVDGAGNLTLSAPLTVQITSGIAPPARGCASAEAGWSTLGLLLLLLLARTGPARRTQRTC